MADAPYKLSEKHDCLGRYYLIFLSCQYFVQYRRYFRFFKMDGFMFFGGRGRL